MTTLVQTRQPLQILSMSHPNKRRRNDRAAAYDESDGDFQFTRGSKRVKPAQPEPIPEDELAPIPPPAKKGRPGRKAKETVPDPVPDPVPAPVPAKKRTSKRATSQAIQDEAPPPPAPPQRATRGRPRKSTDETTTVQANTTSKRTTNGVSKSNRALPDAAADDHSDAIEDDAVDQEEPPQQATPPDAGRRAGGASKKIALPMSDTPIMNRNKEMRKKTAGGRRSSLGMRGRRASSLIDSGHSAIPHREVRSSEFYKHIEAEGLMEPRRMKQLLTWCGERALAEKPPLGSADSNAILGARAIQDQLLKDFSARAEFSDWFSREDVPRPPAIEKPNPRNLEHDEKITELETRIKRLKAEKKKWQSLRAPPPDLAPLFPPPPPPAMSAEDAEAGSAALAPTQQQKMPSLVLPDVSLLDADEAKILSSLLGGNGPDPAILPPTAGAAPMHAGRIKPRAQARRLRRLQSTLEADVDHLSDGVHRVELRMEAAGRQADRVLGLSAARLRERDDRERRAAGTRDMPVMEVLRSLGRILPDNGGGSGG